MNFWDKIRLFPHIVCSTDMISEQDWKWPNYAEEPPFSLIFSS